MTSLVTSGIPPLPLTAPFLLVRFWVNHHLLDIFQRPLWRVIKGRSQAYVTKVLQELPDVRTGCGVRSVVRQSQEAGGLPSITLTTDSGREDSYHAVVMATHRYRLINKK